MLRPYIGLLTYHPGLQPPLLPERGEFEADASCCVPTWANTLVCPYIFCSLPFRGGLGRGPLFTPLPFEAFDVFFDEGVTALHLDEGKGGDGFDGMVMLYGDDDGIACLYALLYAIEHKDAFALHKGPYFGTTVVDLIGDVLSWIERDAFS